MPPRLRSAEVEDDQLIESLELIEEIEDDQQIEFTDLCLQWQRRKESLT